MRDKIISILMDINDSNEYENEEDMMRDEILDSYDIVNLVGELNDYFDIDINVADVTADNFASVDSIVNLVEKKKG